MKHFVSQLSNYFWAIGNSISSIVNAKNYAKPLELKFKVWILNSYWLFDLNSSVVAYRGKTTKTGIIQVPAAWTAYAVFLFMNILGYVSICCSFFFINLPSFTTVRILVNVANQIFNRFRNKADLSRETKSVKMREIISSLVLLHSAISQSLETRPSQGAF